VAGLYRSTHTAQYGLSTVGIKRMQMAKHAASERQVTLEACAGWKLQIRARSAKQLFRGHMYNTCWGNNNPTKWLVDGNFHPGELRDILVEHVNTTLRGIKASADGESPYAWDVVNEACNQNPANATDFFKPADPCFPAVPNYVEVAFRTARDRLADPDALLFYNDYGADGGDTQVGQCVPHAEVSLECRGSH
jgi:hypothetical protein